jgi:hypothetical protein
MEKINIAELDRLITAYFGQDCYMIDDSGKIEPLIDAYIAESPKGMRHALIADIDLLFAESENLDDDFKERYESRFSAELWGTTPTAFLKLIRDKISQSIS